MEETLYKMPIVIGTGFCTIILIIHTRERKAIEYSYFARAFTPFRFVTQCARLAGTLKSLNLCKRENYKLQFIMLSSEMECGDFLLFL